MKLWTNRGRIVDESWRNCERIMDNRRRIVNESWTIAHEFSSISTNSKFNKDYILLLVYLHRNCSNSIELLKSILLILIVVGFEVTFAVITGFIIVGILLLFIAVMNATGVKRRHNSLSPKTGSNSTPLQITASTETVSNLSSRK